MPNCMVAISNCCIFGGEKEKRNVAMELDEYLKEYNVTSVWDLPEDDFVRFAAKGLRNDKHIDLDEYLNQCGAQSVWDLSDEQVMSFCLNVNCGLGNWSAAADIKLGIKNMFLDRKEGMRMLRTAIGLGRTLDIKWTMQEGVIMEGVNIGSGGITMSIGDYYKKS